MFITCYWLCHIPCLTSHQNSTLTLLTICIWFSSHNTNLKFSIFLKLFMPNHLILADDHYVSVKNGNQPWILSTFIFLPLNTEYIYLVLFFFTRGKTSCTPTSHVTLFHLLLSHDFLPQLHLILKIKPLLTCFPLKPLHLSDVPSIIKHSRHIYNFLPPVHFSFMT